MVVVVVSLAVFGGIGAGCVLVLVGAVRVLWLGLAAGVGRMPEGIEGAAWAGVVSCEVMSMSVGCVGCALSKWLGVVCSVGSVVCGCG